MFSLFASQEARRLPVPVLIRGAIVGSLAAIAVTRGADATSALLFVDFATGDFESGEDDSA